MVAIVFAVLCGFCLHRFGHAFWIRAGGPLQRLWFVDSFIALRGIRFSDGLFGCDVTVYLIFVYVHFLLSFEFAGFLFGLIV